MSDEAVERTDEQWIEHFRTGMRGQPNPAIEGLHDLMLWCVEKRKGAPLYNAVEIGTFAGQSASIIAKYVRMLWCVDPYTSGYDPSEWPLVNSDMVGREHLVIEARNRNMGEGVRWHQVRQTSQEAVSSVAVGCQFHFVYIDGDHRYEQVMKDLELWTPRVMDGCFVAGHDYNDGEEHAGVKKAVHEFFGRQPDAVFQDTSWVYQV